MKIRKYMNDTDFFSISNWIQDERTHHLWCAGRFEYPLKRENFNNVLTDYNKEYGDEAYSVIDENNALVGFFVGNVNVNDNSVFLKFVILNNELRHKGNGVCMMQCISNYFLFKKKATVLKLVVFDENKAAQRCYENAGFILETEEKNAFHFQNENWGRQRMIKIL